MLHRHRSGRRRQPDPRRAPLLSSAFVAVNILGNALATIVIAQWEGAVDKKVLASGLSQAAIA